jgi:DNA-binding response OmpR family regulator
MKERPMKLLLVEDDLMVADLLEESLVEAGFE